MFIDGLHEKAIFEEDFPFRLAYNAEENFDFPLHWHNAVELIYVLENSFVVNVNGQDHKLEERDIYYVAGGEIHSFNTKGNNGRRFFIQFDISLLEGFQDINTIKPFLSASRKIPAGGEGSFHGELEEQILKAVHEYNKREIASALAINARVFDMLVILARNIAGTSGEQGASPVSDKSYRLDRLNAAFKYIEDNFQQEITLKDIARASGFSEYHFSRLFKEVTEKNFHNYLNEYRIKKAAKLIADSGKTVSEVAYETGFNSITTFNRIFKSIKGCAPSSYKRLNVTG